MFEGKGTATANGFGERDKGNFALARAVERLRSVVKCTCVININYFFASARES